VQVPVIKIPVVRKTLESTGTRYGTAVHLARLGAGEHDCLPVLCSFTICFTMCLCIHDMFHDMFSPDLDGYQGTLSFTISLCISPDLDGNRGTTKMCPYFEMKRYVPR
jgi:hypothetical protein